MLQLSTSAIDFGEIPYESSGLGASIAINEHIRFLCLSNVGQGESYNAGESLIVEFLGLYNTDLRFHVDVYVLEDEMERHRMVDDSIRCFDFLNSHAPIRAGNGMMSPQLRLITGEQKWIMLKIKSLIGLETSLTNISSAIYLRYNVDYGSDAIQTTRKILKVDLLATVVTSIVFVDPQLVSFNSCVLGVEESRNCQILNRSECELVFQLHLVREWDGTAPSDAVYDIFKPSCVRILDFETNHELQFDSSLRIPSYATMRLLICVKPVVCINVVITMVV
jgi:hypothetical protein